MTKVLSNRNHTIDFMRFLAAAFVVLFHFNGPDPKVHNLYKEIVSHGWLGVPVFFVISGYCILLTAFNSKKSSDFIIRRFFRIFPPFWFSIIIVFAVAVFQKIYTGFNSVTVFPKNLPDIIASFFLYTDPLNKIQTVNWVYWSLSCEWCFYLLIFAGLLLKRQYLIWYFILITAISIIIPLPEKGNLYFFLKDWPSFCLGICIFYLHNFNLIKKVLPITLLMTMCMFALGERIFLSVYTSKELEYSIAAIIAALIILSSNIHNFRMKENLLTKLGDYSYSVYLIHVPIGVYLIGMAKSTIIKQSLFYTIIFDLITYCIISIIAYFVFKYIELSSIRIGKNFTLNKTFRASKNS